MKVLRFIFYLLMPVFLIAGLYTGLRIWFFLLIAQLLLVLVIVALNQWTVRTFSYTQKLDATEAVKGSETALHLSIRNEKPFPLSMMRLDVELAAPSENTQVSFSLLPFAGKDFDFKVSMPYRGVYPVGITTMHITDVFGLLPMRFDMRKLHFYRQPELIVCPRAEVPSSQYAEVADEKLFGERYQQTWIWDVRFLFPRPAVYRSAAVSSQASARERPFSSVTKIFHLPALWGAVTLN